MSRPERIGPFELEQSAKVFPVCTDSLALGAFVRLRKGEKVCDLGCGSGVLILAMLAREPGLSVTGIDIDPDAAGLAKENMERNGVDAEIIGDDFCRVRELIPAGSFDLIVSNPPYFAAGSGKSGGPDRMEETCTLGQLCAAAGWLVRNGGRFALVHRPERLCDIFDALRAEQMEPKRMQFIQKPGLAPSAVLIEAYKQGRPGLQVLPPLAACAGTEEDPNAKDKTSF